MSSDPIEVLRRMRDGWAAGQINEDEKAALDAALASLSAPKPSSVNDNAVAVNESAPVNDKAESAEAVRELEEREQRDEALLRQALDRAHQTAMEQTLKARIPECAEFSGIAQDLDFVVAALRERIGVKA